jgi:hypothetical protein
MSVDAFCDLLLFLHRERRRRKTGENFVENEDLNFSLGLLFFPESIELIQSYLNRSEQVPAGLLHPFTGRLVESVFLQKVKQREFVLAEPFLRRPLLFLVKTVHELDETPVCLLNRSAIFLTIIVGGSSFRGNDERGLLF